MKTNETPQIRVSGPGDLIEAIPFVLGFHPRDSLVLVGLRSQPDGPHGDLAVVLRIDLPDGVPAECELDALITALQRSRADGVVVVLITEADQAARLRADSTEVDEQAHTIDRMTAMLCDLLRAAAIGVLEVLLVTEQRWWSLTCADDRCCPSAGHERELGYSRPAAEAVLAGMVALPDRAGLAERLAGDPPEIRRRLLGRLAEQQRRVSTAELAGRRRRQRTSDLAALHRAADTAHARPARPVRQGRGNGDRLGPAVLARLGVALADPLVRDEFWLQVDDDSVAARELLLTLATRLPIPYDAAPLFLYGWHQWRCGNGAMATMAAERALASDPNYSAARLLLTAVSTGLDPNTVPLLRELPKC
ncbi:MAG: uncharacterized protein JWN95_3457 [Frankiales bacterium]|nr:uncharacterized protein [Frankiales bacterium]